MSTLRCNAIQDTNGVERFLARAWVNFNGTGTVAIRASGNVSSITDIGVGNYTVNFASAMPDANYCPVTTGTGSSSSDNGRTFMVTGDGTANRGALLKTTTQLRVIYCQAYAAAVEDAAELNVAVFR